MGDRKLLPFQFIDFCLVKVMFVCLVCFMIVLYLRYYGLYGGMIFVNAYIYST